ncbi:ABC transporter ATP-binding protein [Anaeromicropila populeti]|uniref:ATP-binding cassette, subfamily B n=1 Tax=Anaeromicropila populeti TaxID=37658 RepID=A0A1I6JYF8_9FIRM|nr:ABC transporter ATP-binding protein [Anaeromicropila populeti]SFR83996.1 ATP-binding cassette, subfamily B [Anaeromicropila populeti]
MNNRTKKFFSFYKPYMGLFLLDMFCAFIVAGITLVNPLIIRYITNTVLPDYNSNDAVTIIARLGLIMLGLAVIQFVCNYFVTYKGHMMGAYMEYDMRNELFEHYQKLSFNFYDNQKTGQLMSRITNDLFDITELCHHGPEDVVISFIKITGAFVILLNVNPWLTLVVFAFIPIMVLFAMFIRKKMHAAFKRNRERVAEINAQVEDNLSGIRVVKSFANEELEIEHFKMGNDRFVNSKRSSYLNMANFHAGLGFFISLLNIAVIIGGAAFISKDTINMADLITFLLYINNLIEPVQKLINFTEQFQNGITGFNRFMDILEIEPDIIDSKGAIELVNPKGDIEFSDVAFKYQDTINEVFRNINLKVKAGEYMALVGSSGVGKTTMCSLIPRFYETTSGEIKIDGINIRDIQLKSLRKNIGVVQQDVYLFAGTVIDNIRYGKLEATREQVIEAAKNANAHDFIMELPDGYDTYIGQRGIKLSGGQKQRLSIARVFLKDPSILIFDEATSALDNESEKIVQESLEKLAKNRTTFVIAHRLTTIRNAKHIIVLTEDGIKEQGTHEELLKKGGIYSKLYTMTK